MNPDLNKLQPYPFEKLVQLKHGIVPPVDKQHIALSIGEPKHEPAAFIIEAMMHHLHDISNYPLSKGLPELREAIAGWLTQRFQLNSGNIDPERHVIPVNGTREALFAFAQAVIDRSQAPLVLMPNPFYQIYEGAALLAGAEPYYLNTTAANGYLPDFAAVPESVWQRCQLLYLCTPGNPTGAVMDLETLQQVIDLADRYDFIIAADECYSELYFDEDAPPPGLLQAAQQMGRDDFKRCVVFHSLSKRSNVPGMRSGFVAGDADIMARFLLFRTYHGCAVSNMVQRTSLSIWQDEAHVKHNRDLYRNKFDAVLNILDPVLKVAKPDASFYLWPETPVDDDRFARDLFAQQNVTVLPGSYLSRDAHGTNPGRNHVRIALVANEDECITAARRIRAFVESL
jgi:N-succinyldiaminopimelate aminotransferase